MKIPALILAGGKAKPEMEAATGQSNRALVIVNGQTLLHHVLTALQEAENVGEIAVIGSVPSDTAYQLLPDTDDFVGNVFAGVQPFTAESFVLITTSDLPFLTGADVTDFVNRAATLANEADANVIYPIIPVAACYTRFPNVKRTSLKLREGEFTGGNLMLVRPAFLLQQRQRIADAYAARKSPLKLALMLGLDMVARLLFSQKLAPRLLTLPMLEARVSRLLGASARALICESPEIATDLDRPSDFAAIGVHAGS